MSLSAIYEQLPLHQNSIPTEKLRISMEGVSVSVYHGLRRYWRTKPYRKLSGSAGRVRRETVRLGSTGGRRRRRVWRIKISPKLTLLRRLPSLKKLLLWLRDSYVKAMLAFANSRVISSAGGGDGDRIYDGARRTALKEYDDKMITEIYKSLVVAQGRIPPRDPVRPTWLGGRLPTVAE